MDVYLSYLGINDIGHPSSCHTKTSNMIQSMIFQFVYMNSFKSPCSTGEKKWDTLCHRFGQIRYMEKKQQNKLKQGDCLEICLHTWEGDHILHQVSSPYKTIWFSPSTLVLFSSLLFNHKERLSIYKPLEIHIACN